MDEKRLSLLLAISGILTMFAYVDWTPIPYTHRAIVVIAAILCFIGITDPRLLL